MNEPRKWVIKPVANIKEGKDAQYLRLEEELTNVRFELEDLLVEYDEIGDKVRAKELEIERLENLLTDLEEQEDNDAN